MHLTTLLLLPIGLAAFVAADCCNANMLAPGQMYYPGSPPPPVEVCDDLSDGTPCYGQGGCKIFAAIAMAVCVFLVWFRRGCRRLVLVLCP